MAKTKEEIVAALVGIYEDVCLLNGQGVDKPVPRAIQGVIQSLDPRNGLMLVRNVKIKLRSQPAPERAAPKPPILPEAGKPQGAQPVRQPQPLKVEPEQAPLSAAHKSEDVAEGENAVVAEPLTADEIESMLSMKPIEAEENYSAERVRATLVSLGTDANGLEIKTYRQLFNITRTHFA